VPVAQVGVPLITVHAMPHVPQFVSVLSGASQPLLATPSQLPKPALQLAIAQVPVPQVEVAFARLHATPQPPQFVSVFSAVSQPLAVTPSQLPKPALQPAIAHEPLPHVDIAFASAHALPHAPQFVLVVSGDSQPLPVIASQLP
jgi:hypothetical protein